MSELDYASENRSYDDDDDDEAPVIRMPLRDYFAGQALAGFCQHLRLEDDNGPIWNPDGVALRVYEIADAMVKARSTEQT